MLRISLLIALLGSPFTWAEPRDVTFAAASSSPVGAGPDAPLGPAVQVLMSDGGGPYARRALFDAAGHVGVFRPGAPTLALPFSEPMKELSMGESAPMASVCGRTLKDDLECLIASGDVQSLLERPENRSRVKRLRFPSLSHKVTRLLPLGSLCLAVGKGMVTCVHFRVDGFGSREKFFLVAPVLQGPSPITTVNTDPAVLHLTSDTSARCAVTEHAVGCEGTSVYGQLGNGATGVEVATSSPLSAHVEEVVAGERFFCARTDEGQVSCWGMLPPDLRLAAASSEHYPLCKLDRAKTDATWKADEEERKAAFEACKKAPCPKGMLDCKLGCGTGSSEKRLFFDHGLLCEEPRGEQPEPRVIFTTRPLQLEGVRALSIAAYGKQLCLIDDQHALQCFGY